MLKWLLGLFFKRAETAVVPETWSANRRLESASWQTQKNLLAGKLRVPLKGNGSFSFDIVGESSYQPALEKIAGRKTTEGKDFACRATVCLEPLNPHDPNAVKVEIAGQTVGYFSKPDAKDYAGQLSGNSHATRSEEVAAKIVGGFKSKTKEGHYGVKLDITRHA